MIIGVVAGCVMALLGLTYVHLALPTQTLLSDYALVQGGMLPVMIGMLALASACLFLAYGLAVREPNKSAAARVLLIVAGAGLMLSAVFPTDPHDGANTLGGELHRWGAAMFFTALPVAGWVLARGRESLARWNAVRALSATSAAALVVYLAAHPAAFTSAWINGGAYYGFLERGLVAFEIVVIVAMALAARTPAAQAAEEPGTQERPPLKLVA
ncbi:DUF998 domain-containing protein [Nonomuraea soli]|uniref:DUF998 domain-containing protein n=1 Tax=Nonomuraea soli TaxID=1032476 RepID=A0A7W0CLL7_9ACTN|nr:DUF998 domain-containing protein [Nonomuraea soli]MBA2893356.1 hypothetical protein [Nonomuraea soli]